MEPKTKEAFERLQQRLRDTFEKANKDFEAAVRGQPQDYMPFEDLEDAEDAIDRRAAQQKPEEK